MKTFTIEKLIELDYKEYKTSLESTKRCFQKTIYDKKSKLKKYFINVYKWNWDTIDTNLIDNSNYEFSSSVYFFMDSKESFQVKYDIISDKSCIEDMEVFFEDIYEVMCCIPDIHNN